MNAIKISIQNDNDKDIICKEENIPKEDNRQYTSLDSDVYAGENEEHVRRNVLHKKEKNTTGGGASISDVKKGSNKPLSPYEKEYIIGCSHSQGGQSDNTPCINYSAENPNRNAFVRKALFVLLIMLLVTCGFIITVYIYSPVFLIKKGALIIGILVVVIFVLGNLAPSAEPLRTCPWNYIYLFSALILLSALWCTITARFNTINLLHVCLSTSVSAFFCLILSCTKVDFKQRNMIICAVIVTSLALTASILVAYYLYEMLSGIWYIVLIVGVTLVYSWTIMVVLRCMLLNETKEIKENHYAFGGVLMYTAIICVCSMLDAFSERGPASARPRRRRNRRR